MASQIYPDAFFTDYEEAIKWLFSQLPMFSRVGAPAYKAGLDTTHALDTLYDYPHRRFRAIHVAGTNGKGSTSHLVASALQAQGYKTGLYTSPHLVDFRERMRINGEMIPKEEVLRFINDWLLKKSALKPSFFELTMMMAFDWFAREGVDFAVIEVGMGGRLDSTNVITPVLSVITNISFDHTQFLGSTLREIAREKAGIIKPGIPTVIGQAEGDVKEVFIKKAEAEKAPIFFAEECKGIPLIEPDLNSWAVTFNDNKKTVVPLAGNYQYYNIRTALCALKVLDDEGISLSEDAIIRGFENVKKLTGLRGRWEIVDHNPEVISDTGHNQAGIAEVISTLGFRYPGKRIIFVLGFVNDKDVSHIVDLFPEDATYIFTQASIPRAMKAESVAETFATVGIKGSVTRSVSDAYGQAKEMATPSDVIYIGGSTFIVADFLQSFQ